MKRKSIIIIAAIVIALIGVGIYLNYKVIKPKQVITKIKTEVAEIQTSTPLQDGDIIFQNSKDKVGEYSKNITGSYYSHLGIIFSTDNGLVVYEAADPVLKITPLDEWIAKGEEGKFTVKRLKRASEILTPENIAKTRAAADKLIGSPYDYAYDWIDKNQYNAEFVWKIFVRGTETYLGDLQMLKDFNLDYPEMAKILNNLYPEVPLPAESATMSPQRIFDSEELVTIAKK